VSEQTKQHLPPPPAPANAARGGEVRMKSGVKNIELNDDGSVK
jgi:hypothetical protein